MNALSKGGDVPRSWQGVSGIVWGVIGGLKPIWKGRKKKRKWNFCYKLSLALSIQSKWFQWGIIVKLTGLWGSCVSAAKTIALEHKNTKNENKTK